MRSCALARTTQKLGYMTSRDLILPKTTATFDAINTPMTSAAFLAQHDHYKTSAETIGSFYWRGVGPPPQVPSAHTEKTGAGHFFGVYCAYPPPEK